jgi:hypothetical protein
MLRFTAKSFATPAARSGLNAKRSSAGIAQCAPKVTFTTRQRQNNAFYDKNRAAILLKKRQQREAERARILAKY